MDNYRFIVITNGNYFARIILGELFNTYKDFINAIVIINGDYKGRTGINSAWQLGKQTALPYLIYKLSSIYSFKIAQIYSKSSLFTVKKQAAQLKISTYEYCKVNSPEVFQLIKKMQPDILISVSCPQMIGKKILNIARINSINIHSSFLPQYAGLAPYFWVLSKGETETAISVHYMTSEFDKGNILAQHKISIQKNESAFGLFLRLAKEGSIALTEAIELALQGDEGIEQDYRKSSYFSNPTFKAYLDLRRNGHVLMRSKELFQTIKQEIN
jgi:folate-dependent phosphoribosylglycinamide formyltransferase PurN